MRRLINNIISVIFTFVKFAFIKLARGGAFQYAPVERFSPNVVTEFNRGSRVQLGRKVRVHSGCKLKVRRGGTLVIGDNARLNYNCVIVCHDEIRIGADTEFGPSVFLYDHDHDYRVGLEKDQFVTGPIVIGSGCWIGANTVILRGTTIGDNCVVAAGSVLHGDIPANSVVYQKRETEIKIREV